MQSESNVRFRYSRDQLLEAAEQTFGSAVFHYAVAPSSSYDLVVGGGLFWEPSFFRLAAMDWAGTETQSPEVAPKNVADLHALTVYKNAFEKEFGKVPLEVVAIPIDEDIVQRLIITLPNEMLADVDRLLALQDRAYKEIEKTDANVLGYFSVRYRAENDTP